MPGPGLYLMCRDSSYHHLSIFFLIRPRFPRLALLQEKSRCTAVRPYPYSLGSSSHVMLHRPPPPTPVSTKPRPVTDIISPTVYSSPNISSMATSPSHLLISRPHLLPFNLLLSLLPRLPNLETQSWPPAAFPRKFQLDANDQTGIVPWSAYDPQFDGRGCEILCETYVLFSRVWIGGEGRRGAVREGVLKGGAKGGDGA